MWNKLIIPADVTSTVLTTMVLFGSMLSGLIQFLQEFEVSYHEAIDNLAERDGVSLDDLYYPFFEDQRRV